MQFAAWRQLSFGLEGGGASELSRHAQTTGSPSSLFGHRAKSRANGPWIVPVSGRPVPCPDLGAVHQAPVIRVEGIVPVHSDSVVPHDKVALAPGMRPGEF